MGLNQFAKISPIVNSEGFLLEKDDDGKYTKVSTIRLKENETGICIDDNSLLTIFEGNPMKLRGGLFDNMEDALNHIKSNADGVLDGQLLVVKSNPRDIYVIIGTRLYNITENQTKTIVINVPNNAISENIFNIIENSIMEENFNKRYLMHTVDIKMPNDNYKFYNINNELVEYPTFRLSGSLSGISYIEINPDCYNSLTRCMFADEFEGKLIFSIDKSVSRYTGDTITLVITYIPLI